MLRLAAIATAIALLGGCGTHAISGKAHLASGIKVPPAKPSPPDLIHENSDRGAQATAGYWLVLADYALLAGNDKVLAEIGTQDCQACINTAEHIREIYNSGAHVTGELGSPMDSTIDYSETNLRVITVALKASELTTIDKDGKRSIYDSAKIERFQFKVVWTNNQWKIAQVADASE